MAPGEWDFGNTCLLNDEDRFGMASRPHRALRGWPGSVRAVAMALLNGPRASHEIASAVNR